MKTAWFCIPSARPVEEAKETLGKWRERGYKIALWRDTHYSCASLCDFLLTGPYPGYANAVNAIAGEVLRLDPACEWIVAGGDDMEPDPNVAPAEIMRQCDEHFAGTFGVMQPTGDRWGEEQGSAYADRVAGSPWMGRDFCSRMYGGCGPLWHEYVHQFVDEELQNVATNLGVFWQRRDLSHFHKHWARKAGDRRDMPGFLAAANTTVHWSKFQALFNERRRSGFPGHEPLPVYPGLASGF